jgi:tyrosyl-tRNA synthetase
MTIDEQLQQLSRRCERIISEAELRKKLERSQQTGKPLRIKLGMDPTAPDVTLGHAVPLSIVRQFQDWGHKAVIIIGDYTARVGDPTGRNQTRKMLPARRSTPTPRPYVAQVGKSSAPTSSPRDPRNGEWFERWASST